MEGPPTVTLRKTHSHQYKALYWSYILWPQKALVLGQKEIAAEALDEENNPVRACALSRNMCKAGDGH